MEQAIKLSVAFQLVNNGPPKKSQTPRKRNDGGTRRNRNGNGKDSKAQNKTLDKDFGNDEDKDSKKNEAPVCLYPAHKAKGIRYYLSNCRACPEREKKELLQKFKDERAASGPSRSARSQTRKTESCDKEGSENKTVLRVATLNPKDSSSFEVEFVDGKESQTATGRTDDGADESIVSFRVAQCAVMNGIGKMKKISPITLQVALKEGSQATKFTFSRSSTVSSTVLKLSAGPLALLNIEYLVADGDLAVEDLLIGIPV